MEPNILFIKCLLQSFNIEFQGQADDEKNIYIEMRTKFDKDTSGNVISISSTLQDISEKKESEFLLLEAMRKTEEASRIKEEFLSAMSHEIRNPLNAIIGLSEHLISQDPKESQLKNLSTIQFSSQHLLSLVNDVLDFSKIRAGKVKIETQNIDMRNLVQGVVSTMEFNAKKAGIKLIFKFEDSVPDYVIGDELRINQILINLISNAIKFTHDGTVTLFISIEKSKSQISEINFNVKDTGIGIAKDKLKKIFESFEQENDSTTREYGGTGLGLSISKQLVSLMGGRQLMVKSTIGKGSEFYFSVPYKNASLPNPDENRKQNSNHEIDSGSMAGIKILCVEDNEINIMVISQYFKKWKIKATYAQTGQEALEAYKKEPFDLVFMDIRLPDMKGYDVAKAIRLEYPDQKIPIIALTAELDKRTEEKILDSGMVDFLSKPFKSEDLSRLILTYATPK